MWFVYCLLCEGENIYVGITSDLERRLEEHCSGEGARYTKAFPPQKMLCAWRCPDRSSAAQAEYMLKKLPASDKREIAFDDRGLPETMGEITELLQPVACSDLPVRG